jgi:hypothetical protein
MLQTSSEAAERFRRSQLDGQIRDLLGLIRGRSTDLTSYDSVARRLRAYQQIEMGTQAVPLKQIVGSVGRYRDFTREFLPRNAVNKERWARVDQVFHSLEGYPPVELYKIGDVYFVRDGNHRVSVARANGIDAIEAYVTEIPTDISFTLDDFERDAWLIKIERAEFQEQTGLDDLRPENNVFFTEPGRYQILLHHIAVHQYLGNLDLERSGSWERLDCVGAVTSWYDNVYTPVVEAIRKYNLLEQFPGRTEADLYLWVAYHREELAAAYDLAPLSADAAVSTFASVYDDRFLQGTFKAIRFGLLSATGRLEKPLGMSDEEFDSARARHDAGERTLLEAETARDSENDAAGNDLQEAEEAVVAEIVRQLPELERLMQ